jgi:hypothetical protein
MSLTPAERETIISFSDDGDTAMVYTAQRPVITKLRNNPSATLVEEGVFDGSAWARFTIPRSLVSFRTGRAPRHLTAEERRLIGERLRGMKN